MNGRRKRGKQKMKRKSERNVLWTQDEKGPDRGIDQENNEEGAKQ